MRSALEKGGVEFIPENGGGPGVRLKRRGEAEHAADSLAALTHSDDSDSARDRADTSVHQYLATFRRPKEAPAERIRLLQLFWAAANPGDVAEKVAAVIEGRDASRPISPATDEVEANERSRRKSEAKMGS